MDKATFEGLNEGDIVRHAVTGNAYVVTGNYGDHVTAVRTVDLTNEIEWVLVAKSKGVD